MGGCSRDLRSGLSCPPTTGVCRRRPSQPPHDIKTPLLLPFRREGKYGPVEMENFNFPLCSLSPSPLSSLSFYIGPYPSWARDTVAGAFITLRRLLLRRWRHVRRLWKGVALDSDTAAAASTERKTKRTTERKKVGRNFASPLLHLF